MTTPWADHPLFPTWNAMKQRCRDPNKDNYSYYGGRGIQVCSRWLAPKWQGFQNFIDDMGVRPEGFTLDRIDPNGDYSPDNCRWASLSEQQHNRVISREPRGVEYRGANRAKPYRARICLNGKKMTLGHFVTREEAESAYKKAFKEHFGRDAW